MDINSMLDVILVKHEVIRETSYDKAVEIVRDLEKKIIPDKKIRSEEHTSELQSPS